MLYNGCMRTKKPAFKPLKTAIGLLGGQTSVARICSKSTGRIIEQGHVSNWLYRDNNVPSDCAMALAIATREKGEEVPPEKLCPKYPWHLIKELLAA